MHRKYVCIRPYTTNVLIAIAYTIAIAVGPDIGVCAYILSRRYYIVTMVNTFRSIFN